MATGIAQEPLALMITTVGTAIVIAAISASIALFGTATAILLRAPVTMAVRPDILAPTVTDTAQADAQVSAISTHNAATGAFRTGTELSAKTPAPLTVLAGATGTEGAMTVTPIDMATLVNIYAIPLATADATEAQAIATIAIVQTNGAQLVKTVVTVLVKTGVVNRTGTATTA